MAIALGVAGLSTSRVGTGNLIVLAYPFDYFPVHFMSFHTWEVDCLANMERSQACELMWA